MSKSVFTKLYKPEADLPETVHFYNDGQKTVDDEEGYLKVKPGDHINFRFEVLSILGKGSFAQVVKAVDHATQKQVAIKINRNSELDHQFAKNEASLLQLLMREDPFDSHNIVRMNLVQDWREHKIFVFELLSRDLYHQMQLNKFKGFSVATIRSFVQQIVKALVLLEELKVIHCDLKPENLVLQEDGQRLKVVDFGSGCIQGHQVYSYVQSRFYRAPEVVLRIPYTVKVDIWSLGCIIAELFTGEPLFPGDSEQELLEYHMEIQGLPSLNMLKNSRKAKHYFDTDGSPYLIEDPVKGILRIPESRPLSKAVPTKDLEMLDFVDKCLELDPEKRMSAVEASKHPFLCGTQAK